MTIDAWLQAAVADAERRGLTELKPLLEALAKSTQALRGADFSRQSPVIGRQSGVISRQSAVVSEQSAVVSEQSSDDGRQS
jgi:hypothetical protein